MPDRALRRKLRLDFAIAATVVAFVVFVAAVLWGLHERQTIGGRICQAQVEDRAALRQSFFVGKRIRLMQVSDAELENVRRFWDGLIASVPPLHCKDGKPIEGRK